MQITTDDLERHALWLSRNPGGVRLERFDSDLRYSKLRGSKLRGSKLRGCDLRDSDLRDSDLSGCDLGGSDLSGCDLRDSDLRDSDLSGCDLGGSDLSGCDLRGAKGILIPPVNDPRGYRCVAVWHPDGWMIAAGCRWFLLPDAIRHWGDDYFGNREIGDAYLAALRWLAEQEAPE